MARKMKRRRAFVTAIPLLLVNAVAFAGQYGYIQSHIYWPSFGQVVFALALESVALFLAYMANQALMAEDSAYGLRLASYAFGLLIGAMNYSHYAPGLHPTFEAVATGLMSVASPWLWGIYSRRQSRDALKAKGLIEPRAVKLGALRWLLWTSRTWKVFRRSVWLGINKPDEALTNFDLARAYLSAAETEQIAVLEEPSDTAELESAVPTAVVSFDRLELCQTKADAVRTALAELGDTVTASVVAGWLKERGWEVTPAHVRVIRSQTRKVLTDE